MHLQAKIQTSADWIASHVSKTELSFGKDFLLYEEDTITESKHLSKRRKRLNYFTAMAFLFVIKKKK